MLRSAYRNPLSGGDEDCSPGHLGSNYSYTPITSADMSAVGFFNITQTSTTDPKKVGRATIVMQVDGGTYSLQTTIAFRNYEGVI